MSAQIQDRIAFGVVVAGGVLLLLMGVISAFNTHLAPDPVPCPAGLECLINLNGTLYKESK